MLLDKLANPINNFGSRQFDIIRSGGIHLWFIARFAPVEASRL
jgi:hypothetical protein